MTGVRFRIIKHTKFKFQIRHHEKILLNGTKLLVHYLWFNLPPSLSLWHRKEELQFIDFWIKHFATNCSKEYRLSLLPLILQKQEFKYLNKKEWNATIKSLWCNKSCIRGSRVVQELSLLNPRARKCLWWKLSYYNQHYIQTFRFLDFYNATLFCNNG